MTSALLEARENLACAVRDADYCLTESAYEALLCFLARPDVTRENLRALSPEFGRSEYFLNMNAAHDSLAAPFRVPESVRLRFGQDLDRVPLLRESLQEMRSPAADTLLVNRWLAHFAGFRHRVVHLFLEHPYRSDCFYVQLRSLLKANAPGALDVALGGHVTGIDAEEDALRSELREELGIAWTSDLEDAIFLGRYDYCGENTDDEFINVESRAVYKARLRPGAVDRIHFADAEVAGICLISREELARFLAHDRWPVASGLRESVQLYDASLLPHRRPLH